MLKLDSKILRELIDLLAPLLESESERRALLTQAFGTDAAVLDAIDYAGSTRPFVTNVIKKLAGYGEVEPGKQALWLLLQTARTQTGLGNKKRVDTLCDVINGAAQDTQTEDAPKHPGDQAKPGTDGPKITDADTAVIVDARGADFSGAQGINITGVVMHTPKPSTDDDTENTQR